MPDFPQIARQQEYYLSLLPEVRRRYGHLPGVDVIGLGDKERRGRSTDEWAWRFYVRKKYPLSEINEHEQIPAEIFGVKTDVLEHFEEESLVCSTRLNDLQEYRDIRVLGGAPIRNEYFGSDTNSGYGTLGVLARVVGTEQLVGLTCAHVVNAAADSMTATGLNIGQPRYWVSCCCCPRGKIGTVSTAVHYSTPATREFDCALIAIDTDVADRLNAGNPSLTQENKILGHNGETDPTAINAAVITITGARSIMCFETVRKRGQGSGLTTGKVVDVAYGEKQMLIRHISEVLVDTNDPASAIDANSPAFACHGDSGAVLIGSDNKVLGMIVAGSMGTYEEGGVQKKKRLARTIATHIKPIMQRLNIKIGGTQFNAMGEPVGGGVNGCELKIWPGGHTNPDLNPAETFESTQFYTTGGNINWEVLAGPGGALIVERDGTPINPGVTTVSNAARIKVRYGNVSASSSATDAVQIKGTRGSERPSTVFRTIFKITPQPVKVSGTLDAANTKNFIGSTDNRTCGVAMPPAIQRYLAKAEITYDVLPADIDWSGGVITFTTGNPAGTFGNILSRRQTKFTHGGQLDTATNRTHTDQAAWTSAGDSSAADFQAPDGTTRNKFFRLANKGFDPVIESQDIDHNTYNPDHYFQRYTRAHYRDRIEFYDGTAWVPLTDYTEWSVNLTAVLTAAPPAAPAAPPAPGLAADNIIEAGLNAAPLPNTQPVCNAGADREVAVGSGTVTLTADINDADLDGLTVVWTQTSGAAVVLSGGGAAGNPRTFPAPGADRRLVFSAICRDNTQGLSRAPAPPNFESAPDTVVINVVETQVRNGGDPRLCLDDDEVFNSAAFHIGGGPVNWNVSGGGTSAVIVEANGNSIAPVTSVAGATSIRVVYNHISASAGRGDTVIIRATNPGDPTLTFIKRRTVNAIPAHVVATAVAPGAPPSIPVGANWGLTFPETVTVTICAFRAGANWQATLLSANGNYSLQAQLLPGVLEVTGPPPGNTTLANYCNQINDLHTLNSAGGAGTWFMISAVIAHENVHATRFLPALGHVSVLPVLQATIDALTVPHVPGMNQAAAIAALQALPAFAAALTTAQANWLARILVLVAGDHAPGGPTQIAERAVVTPMITAICAHRTANGWPACPPACP